MKYKLVNGRLVKATNPIVEGKMMIANATEDILAELGYKELVRTPMPEEIEGFFWSCHYVDNGEIITTEWESIELPPIEESEDNE